MSIFVLNIIQNLDACVIIHCKQHLTMKVQCDKCININ